eukprot:TRINITY_DN5627_c0_g1_i1.p1 TRINITY_DN5627_c0_g1~~TRINITY_DN5627_c0_g1_i1.p1  ORF type:complete len:528 (+),score=47.60 TRINITY_DN5627_c0_g1_i1:76-1584(+)
MTEKHLSLSLPLGLTWRTYSSEAHRKKHMRISAMDMHEQFDVQEEYMSMTEPKPDESVIAERFSSAICHSNITKNRYSNVLPLESTRVKVACKFADSDYINANYIWDPLFGSDPHQQRSYIACQAPLPETFFAFWRMIWNENCAVICMLTKLVEAGKLKADRYWPAADGDVQHHGSGADLIAIRLKSTVRLSDDISLRYLQLEHHSELREVAQIHYTEWPDFGVPCSTDRIREVIRLIERHKDRAESFSLRGPIVAHCSAGIGRSGALLAILLGVDRLRRGHSLDSVNVKQIVSQMRAQRPGMVQTDQQYLFVYRTLNDFFHEHKNLTSPAAAVHGRLRRTNADPPPPRFSPPSSPHQTPDYSPPPESTPKRTKWRHQSTDELLAAQHERAATRCLPMKSDLTFSQVICNPSYDACSADESDEVVSPHDDSRAPSVRSSCSSDGGRHWALVKRCSLPTLPGIASISDAMSDDDDPVVDAAPAPAAMSDWRKDSGHYFVPTHT